MTMWSVHIEQGSYSIWIRVFRSKLKLENHPNFWIIIDVFQIYNLSFHDFNWLDFKTKYFPGMEFTFLKFPDLPGFQWLVWTLLKT